jgi:hypothetical protein
MGSSIAGEVYAGFKTCGVTYFASMAVEATMTSGGAYRLITLM